MPSPNTEPSPEPSPKRRRAVTVTPSPDPPRARMGIRARSASASRSPIQVDAAPAPEGPRRPCRNGVCGVGDFRCVPLHEAVGGGVPDITPIVKEHARLNPDDTR